MKRLQPFTFDEFKNIYSKVPRLCVDLIIKNNNKILLTLRQKNGYVGQWHLPGGTVFYREPVETAIHRIAREELGIEVEIDKFLEYIEYFSEETERGFGYTISLAFICKPKNLDFTLDNQVESVKFFSILPTNIIVEQKRVLEKLDINI